MGQILAFFRRFRPTRGAIRALGQAAWTVARSGGRAFIWGDISAGHIDLRRSSPSLRALVRMGLLLMIALLIGLLFNDAWRAASPLELLAHPTSALSPSFVPRLLVPVTYGLFIIAWAYLLTGALYAHRLVRLGALLTYAVFAISLLGPRGQGIADLLLSTVIWLGLAGVGVAFASQRRRQQRLDIEFPLFLVLVGLTIGGAYLDAMRGGRALGGQPVPTALYLSRGLARVNTLLFPFLAIAGAEVAVFAADAVQWVMSVARRLQPTVVREGNAEEPAVHHSEEEILRRSSRFASSTPQNDSYADHRDEVPDGWSVPGLAAALAAFLIVRLGLTWLRPGLSGDGFPFEPGALIALVGLAALYFLLRRRGQVQNLPLPAWLVAVAALLLYLPLIGSDVAAGLVTGWTVVRDLIGRSGPDATTAIASLAKTARPVLDNREYLVSIFILLVGLALTARDRWQHKGWRLAPLTAVSLLGGSWLLWWTATRRYRRLEGLNFDFEHLDALIILLALGLLIALLAMRRLTPRRLRQLTALSLLSLFLTVQDFLSDPLSPLFGALGAGALFLSLGMFLEIMASGERFALNGDSRAFPRNSRVLLYYGYALMTIITANWYLAGHQIAETHTTEAVTQNGFLMLGLPLAFFALITRGLISRPPTTDRRSGQRAADGAKQETLENSHGSSSDFEES